MDTVYSEQIINWYTKNKRNLPWRNTSDPYRIWISEIILQQTRVNQGLDYYFRFIERFPSVEMLAEADEDEVLKYWQGLGYYSRARNLHKAAVKIMTEHDGVFPADYDGILKLNGVGEYTAAAIASFAFNLPYAVVDGNVYRVLSRLFAINTPINSGKGRKEFQILAQELLSKEAPALHNQAIMEFGALQCVPNSPDCMNCPLALHCKAFEKKITGRLPCKLKKAKSVNRYFNYIFIQYKENTYLQKRTGNDVWHNLYEFPLIEADELLREEELLVNEQFKNLFQDIEKIDILRVSKPVKHVLSHRNIFAQFITVGIPDENAVLKYYVRTSIDAVDKFAVSRLIEIFLDNEI